MASLNNEIKIVYENPSSSINSLQMEHDDLMAIVYELLNELPPEHKPTLSIEEILAPREQENNTQKQPRYQNKFILYLKECIAYEKTQDPLRTNPISLQKKAGENWERLPSQIKQLFTILAEIAAKRHKLKYPDYVYKPQKKEGKQASSEEHGQMSFEEQTFSEERTSPEEQMVFDEQPTSEEQMAFDEQTSFEETFSSNHVNEEEFGDIIDYTLCI
ncbi:1771_t:CDS:1 [Dentiscutata heterogama]|uniref:1771_t:CDS:1 n=1 Tax=Dentiscutata heterogama TaxID=1316150 RepID=A0ACA9KXQ7_9GLOM|nr:1771_t:CDS:1 [Dentiscutata heterogama]